MVNKQAQIQTFASKEYKVEQGSTKKEDNIKENRGKANENCNDFKLQIY